MEAAAAEYQSHFQRLDFLYGVSGYRLTARKPKNVFLGLVSNWILWLITAAGFFFGYLLAFEKSDRYVVVQQFGAFCATLYWFLCATCQQARWDEIQYLLRWFQEVLTRKYPTDYEEIVRNKFRGIMYKIGLIVKLYPVMFIPALVIYAIRPIFTGYRELQFPVVINGTAASEFPLIIYIFLFVEFSFNGVIYFHCFISIQIFFMFCVLFLGNQLEIIAEIMRKLNYNGVRERQRDKRIIKDCYWLHMEFLEKCDVLKRYVNFYGLATLAVPLLCSSMNMFNIAEYGFDLMSFCAYVCFFCFKIILCVFSQIIDLYADRLTEAIYLLNWEDFHVTEQKQILIMLMQSQMGMQLTAGDLFILNLNLITKIARLQFSISALVQNV